MGQRRAVLVGAGAMGRAWAANLRDSEGAVLAGWVDVRPESLAEAVRGLRARSGASVEAGLAYLGADMGEALAVARPDFVVDATPPAMHRTVTARALTAGIPVLGEKPMASSMAEARDMVAVAERTGTLYMVSQNRRYDPNVHALRALIDTEIGPPGILNADFYMGEHYRGFRAEMASPLLIDMAIHTFDAARYLSNADPVAVYCEEFNPPWSWYTGNACATAIFEMTGGLRFTYRGSRCSDGIHTTWDSEWRVVGPRGSAIWDGRGLPRAEVAEAVVGDFPTLREIRPTPAAEPAHDQAATTGIAGTLRAFLHALQTGTAPMSECHDNIKSVAMVFGAIESAATGRRVALPPLWES